MINSIIKYYIFWQNFKFPVIFGSLMPFRTSFLIVFLLLLGSCSSKYARLSRNYSFRTEPGPPNYGLLEHWAAHPFKWDPSDSVSAPLRGEKRDTLIDVFFLHPTTLTKGKNTGNGVLDDPMLDAKTDYTSMLYQATVFNQHARVFCPRYRQAHLKNFFSKDSVFTKTSFDTAYKDLRSAFIYYLKYWNNGRPFILAGHSQGALMAEKLYKEFIEGKPLEKKMIAGYFLGWPIPKEFVSPDKICQDSLDLNCLCSWRTLKNNFIPWYLKKEHTNSYVTNPLSWTTSSQILARSNNKGSLLLKFNKIYPHTTDAWIDQGLLFVHKPRFPWSFLYFKRNYHVADINLFYMNLRTNIDQRVRQYFLLNPAE